MLVNSSAANGDHGDDPSKDILVVDDDQANLLAMETALGPLGSRVVRAGSGEEALRLLLDRDFAVILLDVQMPMLGGIETARIIRERKRSRSIPIIFITAYGRDEQDVLAAYKLGAVDFLFKPIVAEILRSKAGVFVELRRRTIQIQLQSERLREHERREHERAREEEKRRWSEEAMQRRIEELAEADRQKDEFLAVLGHELRNPLSAVVMGCDLLQRRLNVAPPIAEATRDVRARIERQARYLRRLVDDLLDLSRINTGKIHLQRSTTNIRDAIEQAVGTHQAAIEKSDHRLTIDVPQEEVVLWADPDRLVQIISNLLNNAIHYTPEHGEITIRCLVRRDAGVVEVQVTDNGRGIAPDFLPRIFDSFVQERSDGSGHGLGLGLAIVKRLTALHAGTVVAESKGLGMGSTFTLSLPLTCAGNESCRDEGGPTPSGHAYGRPLSIVLVEDNSDIRDSMQELLTDLGHAVRVAGDGRAGADLIVQTVPDVAIIDLGLPLLDGYQVAELVRSTLGTKPLLVALSGYGQGSDRQRTKAAGFDTHLIKPADIQAVVEVLSGKSP